MTEEEKRKRVDFHVAHIKHHDGPIMLPTGMKTTDAIEVLMRKAKYDEEEVVIRETIPAFIWDGALALKQALTDKYGLALQQAEKFRFFGQEIKIPPKVIQVPCGVDETVAVPWGDFMIPGVEGKLTTSAARNQDGMVQFEIAASIKHKDEELIRELFAYIRALAKKNSIYRGKAIEVKFRDENGEPIPMPTPNFMNIYDHPPIFSQDIQQAIDDHILTPIRLTEAVMARGRSLKRGALLAGEFGTGKTLTAHHVAKICGEHGWTFVYAKDQSECVDALRFARTFQPAVLFVEDIDRVAGQVRTDEVDEVITTLDGIGSKRDKVISIFTSNNPKLINKAMRRTGRIDLTLEIKPPDPEAAIRLIRYYAADSLPHDADLTEVGKELEGQIPANIREVVDRASLSAINRAGGPTMELTVGDLMRAAKVLKNEQGLFAPEEYRPDPVIVARNEMVDKITANVMGDLKKHIDEIKENLEALMDR